ncbi:MAG: DUF6671 family protein, partial [Dermatophilaceae bacterium]
RLAKWRAPVEPLTAARIDHASPRRHPFDTTHLERPTREARPPATTVQRTTGWDHPDHPYAGRTAVLSTKHDKLPLIGPPLERAVGLRVEAVAVDTDTLGTFTGDIPRLGSPLDTAIAKARLGMSATGQDLGIASEGSIGPHPALPFVIADRELVVLVDDSAGIVVWETHSSWDIVTATTTVRPGESLEAFITQAGFPTHQLIVRPNSGHAQPIYKGVTSLGDLATAISECASVATDGFARVETDLRAHACPSRRTVIADAAERLACRIAARCPACGAPGWGRIDVLLGVPCAWCGTDIARPRAEIDGCPACEHRETRPVISSETRADPGECPICNP